MSIVDFEPNSFDEFQSRKNREFLDLGKDIEDNPKKYGKRNSEIVIIKTDDSDKTSDPRTKVVLKKRKKVNEDAERLLDRTPKKRGPALGKVHDPEKKVNHLAKAIANMRY